MTLATVAQGAMAFRFRLDEPFDKGFRRIGRQQIARARKSLAAGDATGVHETRKCLKRLRALLRLARPVLGTRRFRRENERFRSIGQSLSGARDGHVIATTLLAMAGDEATTSRTVATAALAIHRAWATRDGSDGQAAAGLEGAGAALAAATDAWATLKSFPETIEDVAQGLSATFRQGQDRLAIALSSEEAEAFHDLRKSMQLHWRHMALLSAAWPALLAIRIEEARTTVEALGLDHDLAVVVDTALPLGGNGLTSRARKSFQRAVQEKQHALRQEALARASRLLAGSADGFAEAIVGSWHAATALPQPPRVAGST